MLILEETNFFPRFVGQPCNNITCLYLHNIGAEEDSFGKDEIAAVHTRYYRQTFDCHSCLIMVQYRLSFDFYLKLKFSNLYCQFCLKKFLTGRNVCMLIYFTWYLRFHQKGMIQMSSKKHFFSTQQWDLEQFPLLLLYIDHNKCYFFLN